ncbi:MAG: hypothetical protein IID32_00090 [Planctomycetes bacterium]|nr:hypothetical protein [Planctomycetota bacterium]
MFYTNKRIAHIGMFIIDLDKVKGYSFSDIKEVADYITDNFHQNSYYEPSTSGKGISIYIFVDFTYWNRLQANKSIAFYVRYLGLFIADKFFPTVDKAAGTYSGHKLSNRGTLGKLPMPKTKEDFLRLVNGPVLSIEDINKNGRKIESLWRDLSSSTSNTIPSPSPYIFGAPNGSDNKNDVMKRTVASVGDLYRTAQKVPTYQEWENYYFSQNLNATPHRGNREERFDNAADYIRKHYNPNKDRGEYRVGDFIEDIKRRITEDEIAAICEKTGYSNTQKKRRITYEDLDVCMGYHWLCALCNKNDGEHEWVLTSPSRGVVKWFQDLKAKGHYHRSCSAHKRRPMRMTLQRIGYITLLDDHYDFNLSQKWGIGENFPKYEEYIQRVGYKTIQEVAKNKASRLLV